MQRFHAGTGTYILNGGLQVFGTDTKESEVFFQPCSPTHLPEIAWHLAGVHADPHTPACAKFLPEVAAVGSWRVCLIEARAGLPPFPYT